MKKGEKERLIQQHLEAIRDLQVVPEETGDGGDPWPPKGYYLVWHLVVGTALGGVGAAVSLLANVIGAPLFGKPSLELVRIFLTFPMAEAALAANEVLVLYVGCGLYLMTGALYGVAFHLVMSQFFAEAPASRSFAAATAMGLALWIVNFYLILSWLQPLLLGGNWIVRLIPFWVAAGTHLVFAWTMWVGERWAGRFEPGSQRIEAAA
jgi:hypothetical protein